MIFNINANPGRGISNILALILFVISIFLYGQASNKRHAENPNDKLIPTPAQMAKSFSRAVFQPVIDEEYNEDGELIPSDKPKTLKEARARGEHWEMLKQGEWQLWEDTKASGYRVIIAMIFI